MGMNFGLGISFGRLCRRKRSLEEIYAEARKIEGWECKEGPGGAYEINSRKGTVIYVGYGPSRVMITSM